MTRNKSRIKDRQIARRQAKAIYAAMKTKELQFERGDVQIEAAKSEEGKEKGPPTFSMLAYTGGKMRPGGWYSSHPLIVDIAGMEFPKSGVIPVHRDHDTGKVVGHTTAIEAKNSLRLAGVVSASNDHANEIVGSSKNAFPWQSSIGATLTAEPQFVPEGETVFVNGRRHAGPVYVARKSRLFEASFVSLGADSRTSAVAASNEGSDMEFSTWLEARGFKLDELADKQLDFLKAQFEAEKKAETADDEGEKIAATKTKEAPKKEAGNDGADTFDYVAERRRAISAELKRETLINAKLRDYPEIAAKAIEEGWSEDKIELAYFKASAAKAPAIHTAPQLRDTPKSIECALYLAGMVGSEEQAVKAYGEKVVEVTRNKAPRSAGLQWLCFQVMAAGGEFGEPGTFGEEHIAATFRAEKRIQAASGFSTIGLAGTLSNLANKQLLAAYNAVPSVINRIARVATHSDFKVYNKYRVQSLGYLDKVGPTGEIQHAEMGEATYTNQLETYAKMMALTRPMLRNDDLSAFLAIPQEFGRMTAVSKEQSFFKVLLDNTDGFFATAPTGRSPNQLASGASSALSVTSLGEAERLFLNQVDQDGKPISLMPSILLVSTSNKKNAENLTQKNDCNGCRRSSQHQADSGCI